MGAGCAVAEAGVNFFSCGADDSEEEASADAVGRAVATAWAKAVTAVNIECAATEGASVCSWADSSIRATAQATGQAFAAAWAGEITECGCTLNEEEVQDIIATVCVDATLEVTRDFCICAPPFPACSSCHLLFCLHVPPPMLARVFQQHRN